jgi:hypothetical protein
MLKLLWQLMTGTSDDDEFHHRFTAQLHLLRQDAARCAEVLPPIQARLRRVLNGIVTAGDIDRETGQTAWGEQWYLPRAEAHLAREHIQRARPDLLEQRSEYPEAVEVWLDILTNRAAFIDPPFSDPDREYLGDLVAVPGVERREPIVWVRAGDGLKGLVNARHPFSQRAGTGFGWGYEGGGAHLFAVSLLADVFDGDLKLAEALASFFVEEIVAHLPWDGWMAPFYLRRGEVLNWFTERIPDAREALEHSGAELAERRSKFQPGLAKQTARLDRIRSHSPLFAQRFDLVPPDFECALYLDLMDSLRLGKRFFTCSHCNRLIPDLGDAHSNRQRARWKQGRPVYHEECARAVGKERKRSYFAKRSADPTFREDRRHEARRRRRTQKLNIIRGIGSHRNGRDDGRAR